MAKLRDKDGFTLIEGLCVLAILSVMTFGLMRVNLDLFVYKTPLYVSQIKAMHTMTRVYASDSVWFNANGNVNHAGTYSINGKVCIIQLGFGRYRCE